MEEGLDTKYKSIRHHTESLCVPLEREDFSIQGMEEVSPPKWHLAHTTWFFETFILKRFQQNYVVFHPTFHDLFNSYYQGLGMPFPRAQRGLLSRPLVHEVYEYRHYVDEAIIKLLSAIKDKKLEQIQSLIILGLEHEMQHQELLLMDIKYNFSLNPVFPAYHKVEIQKEVNGAIDMSFIEVPEGMSFVGHAGRGFCFDNELPRHQKFIGSFSMGSRLVSNKDFLEFIVDGGYKNPLLWLADGWDWVLANCINGPLYWHNKEGNWWQFSLSGLQPLDLAEPVSHISFYEADAYARWRGCRLPFEEEWEYFVDYLKLDESQGNFLENKLYSPLPASQHGAQQFFGSLWEWTASSYLPYPGYQPEQGNLMEYNGKFMNNQRVLKGGSCLTSSKQIRKSYRNFFQPDKRWQFSGIRLVLDH